MNYDSTTGRYMVGPLPPGKCELSLYGEDGDKAGSSYRKLGATEVEVISGEVLHFDIDEASLVPIEPKPKIDMPERGRVVRDDGESPAYGALVFWVDPDDGLDEATMTDATGRCVRTPFCPGLLYRSERGHSAGFVNTPWLLGGYADPHGSPTEPVVVALLPGVCGAAILGPDEWGKGELLIRLPRPIAVRGRVTVKGKDLSELPATVSVIARNEDHGCLDNLLAVESPVGPDGTFELRGLTPGRCRIQAALDKVWLSESVTLDVPEAPEKALEIDLSIDPGDTALYRLVDETGTPLASVEVAVESVKGPYADELWPESRPTDGAGILRLEGLPAGKNTIRLVEDSKTFEITVPPLGKPDDTPSDLVVR